MPLFEVENGPFAPPGKQFDERTNFKLTFPERPFEDGLHVYPQTGWDAVVDLSFDPPRWKPANTLDGTPFMVPGVDSESSFDPPLAHIVEEHWYVDLDEPETIIREPRRIIETSPGKWNYALPATEELLQPGLKLTAQLAGTIADAQAAATNAYDAAAAAGELVGDFDAINEGVKGLQGNEFLSANRLKEWVEASAFEILEPTYDDLGNMISGLLQFPDGSTGTFIMSSLNEEFGLYDSFEVHHEISNLTIFQPAVTRDEFGFVTDKPPLEVTP